jgi:hypothetical protein
MYVLTRLQQNCIIYVGLEVFTALVTKSTIFWDTCVSRVVR